MASPSGGRCILLLGRRGVLWQLVGRGVGGRRETNGAVDGCCILPSDTGKRKKVWQHVGRSWAMLEVAVATLPAAGDGLSFSGVLA